MLYAILRLFCTMLGSHKVPPNNQNQFGVTFATLSVQFGKGYMGPAYFAALAVKRRTRMIAFVIVPLTFVEGKQLSL